MLAERFEVHVRRIGEGGDARRLVGVAQLDVAVVCEELQHLGLVPGEDENLVAMMLANKTENAKSCTYCKYFKSKCNTG